MSRGNVQSVSLLLNLVLLGVIAFGLIARQNRKGAASQESAAAATRSEAVGDGRSPAETQNPSQKQTVMQEALRWRDLESTNYNTYIANLRAVGCPEETICDIIGTELRKLYDSKKLSQYPGAADTFKYWLTAERQRIQKADLDNWKTQSEELDKEREAMQVELLGHSCNDSHMTPMSKERAEFESRLGFLPEFKRDALLAIVAKFPGLEEQVELMVDNGPRGDGGDERLKTLELYDQKRAELAQLLTPEEYERYELNDTWTARNVRRRLAGFNPTEEEFRGIFKLWRAQDESLVSIYANGFPDPGTGPVNAEVKKFLGDDRYEQYRRTWSNPEINQMAELAQDFQLPDDTPMRFDSIKQDIVARQTQIRANASLSPEQQAEAIQALRIEAMAAIRQQLGPAARKYLSKPNSWLRNLGGPLIALP